MLHIYCSEVRSHCSAPESNKQNPRDRTLDLPIFFRYKHIPSLKSIPLPALYESLPYWFQGKFAASFVLNFCLREFLLSAFGNRFELKCEPKRLMLLYYKICRCLFRAIFFKRHAFHYSQGIYHKCSIKSRRGLNYFRTVERRGKALIERGLIREGACLQNQMTWIRMMAFQFLYSIFCGFNIQFYESKA